MSKSALRTIDSVPSFYALVQRIIALIPGLSHKSVQVNADRCEVEFDPRCGGLIERNWPEVFALCEECGCHAHFEWTEGTVMRSILDTASAAPVYSTEPVSKVRLYISDREGRIR